MYVEPWMSDPSVETLRSDTACFDRYYEYYMKTFNIQVHLLPPFMLHYWFFIGTERVRVREATRVPLRQVLIHPESRL